MPRSIQSVGSRASLGDYRLESTEMIQLGSFRFAPRCELDASRSGLPADGNSKGFLRIVSSLSEAKVQGYLEFSIEESESIGIRVACYTKIAYYVTDSF